MGNAIDPSYISKSGKKTPYIGKYIVKDEQLGYERAAYGKKLLKALSEKLCLKYGEGWSYSNLRQIRQFYLAYANLTDGVCQLQFDLSWSHYLILMRIENHDERNFYEIEARFCLFGV